MNDLKTVLNGLTPELQSYVFARSKAKSRTEAFGTSGLSKSKFYALPESEQARLDEIAAELQSNRILQAEPKLNDATEQAVDTLIMLLKAKSDFVKLQAAVAILDRTMGKPTERVDMTSGGKTLKMYVGVSPDDWDSD